MRKNKLSLLITGFSIFLFWIVYNSKSLKENFTTSSQSVGLQQQKGETKEQDGILQSQQMEFELTHDVSLGYIPKYRLINAHETLKQQRRQNGVNRTTALSWSERGPNSDVEGPSNVNGRVSPGQVTAGRIRTIWVDLADATNQTVWTGGVDGGIWKTNNIVADPAAWSLVTDMSSNIAIASICQSPVNTDIMYFGTGEKTNNQDAVRGGGVWKSTDHGVTWNLLPSTVNFWNVSKLVCDNAGNLYVATMGSNLIGIQRSTDGGNTWTNITPTGLNRAVTEMELSSTGRMHIVCGYRNGFFDANPSGYRFTDNPSTITAGGWTSPTTVFSSTAFNVDLATAGNSLYALPSDASFQTPQVWKSTDGGVNWTVTATTPPVGGNTPVSNGQAWYNLAIGVDPTEPNKVMVGGLNGYLTTNGGSTWSPNSVWVTGVPGSSNYVHADHQVIVWNNNQLLNGGDGGIFYSGNDGTTFSDRNVGLRLKQFYSVAIHPASTNYFLGGTQDNGSHQLNAAGITNSVEVTGGDGGFSHIDQDEPQFQFGSYTRSDYLRSTDGGTTWTEVDFGTSGQFINPTDYDDISNKLYASWSSGQYHRWDDPQTGNSAVAVPIAAFNNATVRHVKVSPYTVNKVFFGTGGTNGGKIVRVDNAHLNTPLGTDITGSGMPASPNSVSCVAIGTTDNNLLATFSNYGLATNRVWISTSGGGASGWTNITGNLPDIPIRWAMFYPEDNNKAILATDLGVWETTQINGAATIWVQDPNFPPVRVDMLQYRPMDGLLAAGTHGRGIWTAPIPFAAPYVRFSFGYNTKTETTGTTTSCRRYTDYTVNMTIDKAPTGNAIVTLSGSGTASQGIDYDITSNGDFINPSNTVTFASGATTPQTITIRIYNDAEVESTESFTLTYSIGGGTDAQQAPSSLSYNFTISDNDFAPVPVVAKTATIGVGGGNLTQPFRSENSDSRSQIIYPASELIAAGLSAGTVNSIAFNVTTKVSTAPYSNFTVKMKNTLSTSVSLNFESGTTTVYGPVSFSTVLGINTIVLTTPFVWDGSSNLMIDICYDNAAPTSATGTSDRVSGNNPGNTYFARNNVGPGCTMVTTVSTLGGKPDVTINLSTTGSPVETAMGNNKSEYVGNNGTYYFYSASTGNILNSLSGSTGNLGCVSSSIFESGTTWQNFQNGQRSQKVFDITPTTNPGSSYTIGLYFTNAELGGKPPNGLQIGKTTAATMADANPSNTIIATTANPVAFGSGWLYTATFTEFSKFFLVEPGVVVPVTLLSFKGYLNNNKILLDWRTSSEQNSKHFELEKSSDGVNFRSIGIVAAAGNSSSDRSYNFTDRQVNELNYYRLKMVDIDGRFIYSKTILIKKPNANQDVLVVNNPFRSFIDVRFTRLPKQNVQMMLLNMTGAKIYSNQYEAAEQIRFDLSSVSISNGTYMLRIIVDGKQYVHKVVKQ